MSNKIENIIKDFHMFCICGDIESVRNLFESVDDKIKKVILKSGDYMGFRFAFFSKKSDVLKYLMKEFLRLEGE